MLEEKITEEVVVKITGLTADEISEIRKTSAS
jgi:hypothetical protein